MVLGIDVGGTKTLIGLFDENGVLLGTTRLATNPDYKEFLTETCRASKELFASHDINSVVIGLPGLLDRQNGIGIMFGHLPWKNIRISSDLREGLGFNGVVLIENDANLAGLGEAQNLRDKSVVVYITISTGIGTAIITDGILNPYFLDSEGGHLLVEVDGNLHRWDTTESGKAIVEEYHQKASEISDPNIWDEIAKRLAPGFSSIIALLQPDAIIVGGSVGVMLDKFKHQLLTHLSIEDTPILKDPLITSASYDDKSVLYGAYTLSKQHDEHS